MKKISYLLFGIGCLSIIGGCFGNAFALYSGSLPENKELSISLGDITPTTKSYYLNTRFYDGSSDWDTGYGQQKIFVHVWNSTTSDDLEMKWQHDRIWKVDLPINTYTSILFCRVNPAAESFDWNMVYNQTEDLNFVADKDTAQITSWHKDNDDSKPSTVMWVS